MHHTVKTLAKTTVIYSLSNIIVRGCTYLVLLLQTGMLTPSAYSIITEFYGYIGLGQVIYSLAMDMTYFRFVHELGKQHTFNIIITILLTTSVIFSMAIILFAPQIAKITNHLSHIRYFYYMAGILTLDTLLIIPYANLRVEQKTFGWMLVQVLQAFAHIFFSLILLYLPSCLAFIEYLIYRCFNITVILNTLDAVFITNLWSSATALILLLPNFKGFSLLWKSSTIQVMWGYASTSFFSALFLTINYKLPMLLFRKLVPNNFYVTDTKEAILGNFAMAYKLALLITLGIQAFKYAAEPFFFANSDRKDAPKLYSQAMHLFILVSCMLLLLSSVNLGWIAKILIPNAHYRNTIDVVPYVTFVPIVLGIYYNFSISFKLSDNPQYGSWVSAFGSLVIGVLSFWLIPKFGHWGCVYASISSATAMAFLGYYIGQKCYPIPYYKQGFVLLTLTFWVSGKASLWPVQLAFLGLGWAYILLNITIIAAFCIMGIAWKKSMYLLKK